MSALALTPRRNAGDNQKPQKVQHREASPAHEQDIQDEKGGESPLKDSVSAQIGELALSPGALHFDVNDEVDGEPEQPGERVLFEADEAIAHADKALSDLKWRSLAHELELEDARGTIRELENKLKASETERHRLERGNDELKQMNAKLKAEVREQANAATLGQSRSKALEVQLQLAKREAEKKAQDQDENHHAQITELKQKFQAQAILLTESVQTEQRLRQAAEQQVRSQANRAELQEQAAKTKATAEVDQLRRDYEARLRLQSEALARQERENSATHQRLRDIEAQSEARQQQLTEQISRLQARISAEEKVEHERRQQAVYAQSVRTVAPPVQYYQPTPAPPASSEPRDWYDSSQDDDLRTYYHSNWRNGNAAFCRAYGSRFGLDEGGRRLGEFLNQAAYATKEGMRKARQTIWFWKNHK